MTECLRAICKLRVLPDAQEYSQLISGQLKEFFVLGSVDIILGLPLFLGAEKLSSTFTVCRFSVQFEIFVFDSVDFFLGLPLFLGTEKLSSTFTDCRLELNGPEILNMKLKGTRFNSNYILELSVAPKDALCLSSGSGKPSVSSISIGSRLMENSASSRVPEISGTP